MRAKLLRLRDVSGADWGRWAALAERAAEPNAALDPRFLAPDQGSGEGNHLLLVAEEGGEWFGLLRVYPTEAPSVLGLRGFDGGNPAFVGPPHPLIDGSRAVDALVAIAWGSRRLLRHGYLTLHSYPASGPLADAVEAVRRRRAMGTTVVATHSAAWLNVPLHIATPSPEDQRVFPAQIDPDFRSTETRKKLRREARRLAEAGGGPLTLQDVGDDPAAVDRFVTMQASGWKGDQERGGWAVALDPQRERTFREKLDAFRASGDLIILELWAGPEHVHSAVLLISGGVAMGFLDAYQQGFGEFSAGKLARVAMCAHLRQQPRLVAVNPALYQYGSESTTIFPDRRDFLDLVIGVGIVPSLVVRLLPRAASSHWLGRLLFTLSRADRLAIRIVDVVRRRLSSVHR